MTSLPLPLPGDVLACSGRSLSSYAIRAATWSRVSHVAVVADWEFAGRLVFECTNLTPAPCIVKGESRPGCQAHPFDGWLERYDGAVWIYRLARPLNDPESARLTERLLHQIHIGFSLAFAARACLLGHENPDKNFCSLYVDEGLAAAGRRPAPLWIARSPAALLRAGMRQGVFQEPERLK